MNKLFISNCIFILLFNINLKCQTNENHLFKDYLFLCQSSCIAITSNFDNKIDFSEINLTFIFDSTLCENRIIPRLCCESKNDLGTDDENYWKIFEEFSNFKSSENIQKDSSYISIVFFEHGHIKNTIFLTSDGDFKIYMEILLKYFNKILGVNKNFIKKFYKTTK